MSEVGFILKSSSVPEVSFSSYMHFSRLAKPVTSQAGCRLNNALKVIPVPMTFFGSALITICTVIVNTWPVTFRDQIRQCWFLTPEGRGRASWSCLNPTTVRYLRGIIDAEIPLDTHCHLSDSGEFKAEAFIPCFRGG